MPEITREIAKSLVSQFTAFAPFPQATEGLTITINTLIACARSESHARAIVREIVETPGEPAKWPPPDRIRSVAWALLTESEKVSPCTACNGSGWAHTEKLINGVMHDFSAPCKCRIAVQENQPKKNDRKMASAAESMEEIVW